MAFGVEKEGRAGRVDDDAAVWTVSNRPRALLTPFRAPFSCTDKVKAATRPWVAPTTAMAVVVSMSRIAGSVEENPNQWGVGRKEKKVYQKEGVIVWLSDHSIVDDGMSANT